MRTARDTALRYAVLHACRLRVFAIVEYCGACAYRAFDCWARPWTFPRKVPGRATRQPRNAADRGWIRFIHSCHLRENHTSVRLSGALVWIYLWVCVNEASESRAPIPTSISECARRYDRACPGGTACHALVGAPSCGGRRALLDAPRRDGWHRVALQAFASDGFRSSCHRAGRRRAPGTLCLGAVGTAPEVLTFPHRNARPYPPAHHSVCRRLKSLRSEYSRFGSERSCSHCEWYHRGVNATWRGWHKAVRSRSGGRWRSARAVFRLPEYRLFRAPGAACGACGGVPVWASQVQTSVCPAGSVSKTMSVARRSALPSRSESGSLKVLR